MTDPTKCEWLVPSTKTCPRHRCLAPVEWVRKTPVLALEMRLCTAHKDELLSNYNSEFRLKEEPLWERVENAESSDRL